MMTPTAPAGRRPCRSAGGPRNDPERADVGIIERERLLDCPEMHMRFHFWYLKEHGWITRLENGTLAITAARVDRLLDARSTNVHHHLLRAAEDATDQRAGTANPSAPT